jgi:long-chain acyl-CoA synthetase
MVSASTDHRDAAPPDTATDALEVVLARMRGRGSAPAIAWPGREYTYDELFEMIDAWTARFPTMGVGAGRVCAVLGDYSPQACALVFALMQTRAILVPFTYASEREVPALRALAGVEVLIRFDTPDSWRVERTDAAASNALVDGFRARRSPGLIVFTSGSTGTPKGILHDCERVMRKFVAERPGWRTVLFLLMDHFGGFNTLLSTFAYSGVAVCVPDRAPDAVCRAIEDARATLLPTTPTFLNLLVTSGAYRAYDLSSVRLITYGTEVMPEATLARLPQIFPNVELKQTYGLSELGVLRSKSQANDSVWVRLGGEGFEVKIIDGMLWVRSEANMVGYLNAPSPFDDAGWMCTGDQVEVRGDYVRILGRDSDIINVGGQKVFPAEVESVLLEAPNVAEASVYGVGHPLLGSVVHARLTLEQAEEPRELGIRMRQFCLERLAKYKVPVRFVVADFGTQHSPRFKRLRQSGN